MKKLGFLLLAVCLSTFTLGCSGDSATEAIDKGADSTKEAVDAGADAAKDAVADGEEGAEEGSGEEAAE